MAEMIMTIENLCKSFGVTRANRDISLSIPKGCVYGLAGENGSGKSTMASILCGMQKADSGTILMNGKPYRPKNPIDANEHRVAMVVQELGVVDSLPGCINMYLGKTKQFERHGILSMKRLEESASRQFDQWGITHVPLLCAAGELHIEQRKIMELARALSYDPEFLVLDEISQALSHDNRQMLYRFIKRFTGMGRTILMITHDLEEMMEVCGHIAVLRDGEIVAAKETKQFTMDELKRLMIGRELKGDYYRADMEEKYQKDVVLRVTNMCAPCGLEAIHFELHKGEILGVCGLSDGGIHELGLGVFGLLEGRSGEVKAVLADRELRTPGDVILSGGAYLSKDRDRDGLMLEAGIGDNIIMPSLKELSKGIYLSMAKRRELARQVSREFEIKATGIRHVVKRLSGGNKQKVNLSRWLSKDLQYIILDCPTRGVDIGVKAYIYDVLKQLKEKGIGILLITDELPEAMGMADRLLIMREHKQAGVLSRNCDFVEDKIVEVML